MPRDIDPVYFVNLDDTKAVDEFAHTANPSQLSILVDRLKEHMERKKREKIEEEAYKKKQDRKLKKDLKEESKPRRDILTEKPIAKQEERQKIERALKPENINETKKTPVLQPTQNPKPVSKPQPASISKDIRMPQKKTKPEESERKKREREAKPYLEQLDRTYNRLYKKLQKRIKQKDEKDARNIEEQLRQIDQDIKVLTRWSEGATNDLPPHLHKIIFPHILIS